jgi:hypothetical protein
LGGGEGHITAVRVCAVVVIASRVVVIASRVVVIASRVVVIASRVIVIGDRGAVIVVIAGGVVVIGYGGAVIVVAVVTDVGSCAVWVLAIEEAVLVVVGVIAALAILVSFKGGSALRRAKTVWVLTIEETVLVVIGKVGAVRCRHPLSRGTAGG